MAKNEPRVLLYENGIPDKGSRFIEIYVAHPAVNGGLFETKVLEGIVKSGEPEFDGGRADVRTRVNRHATFEEAKVDAEAERDAALGHGYDFSSPR